MPMPNNPLPPSTVGRQRYVAAPWAGLLVALALVLLSAPWRPLQAAAMPERDYHFEVLLDGDPIGSHRFQFDRQGQGYNLTSTADYLVKVLFIPVYRYQHRSQEVWRDGCLVSIDAATDDNGTAYSVTGEQAVNRLVVAVNDRQQEYPVACARTFAYWQPALLDTDRLLNSQTGELDDIGFSRLGPTPLPWDDTLKGETIELTTSQGDIRLWYRDGRWLGLLSTLESGRQLLYRPAPDQAHSDSGPAGEGQAR